MEELISESLKESQNVHKSIKIIQSKLNEPLSCRTLYRIKMIQLALVKNDYLNAFKEHNDFVNTYEQKLCRILKREAQISEHHSFSISQKREFFLY